ncbi:MAG: hypothetical protein LAT50_02495 [Ectothiorhodospiraceae bacterium]|nr:hypothetical protein [Ectothiorhodospiraceae bacterium]
MDCVLPDWQGWLVMLVAVTAGIGVGYWTAQHMEAVGQRKHVGNFHGRRLYNAAGVALGVLAFALVTMMALHLGRQALCSL